MPGSPAEEPAGSEPIPGRQIPEAAPEASPAPEGSAAPATDAPPFEPLEAPAFDSNDGPLAQSKPVELGPARPFPPSGSDRAKLSEVSRSESPAPRQTVPQWTSEYQSAGKRPIQSLRVDGPQQPVLIVGSLYGNEPESVALIDQLVTQPVSLSSLPHSLWLVRTANPDGLAEHIRTNLNGVDLNRNFPSTLFTANPSQQTGPRPASEPETQAVMRLLQGAEPVRVVHLRSTVGSRPLVLVNELLRGRLSSGSLPMYADWGTFEGGFKAGSLEEYVSVRMAAEMMTILLPPDGFSTLTPQQLLELSLLGLGTVPNQNAGLAADTAGSNSGTTTAPARARPDSAPPGSPPHADPALEATNVRGVKGYVEFLPPPPDAALSDPRESRYYELPPPPE